MQAYEPAAHILAGFVSGHKLSGILSSEGRAFQFLFGKNARGGPRQHPKIFSDVACRAILLSGYCVSRYNPESGGGDHKNAAGNQG